MLITILQGFCLFFLGIPFFLLGVAIRQGWVNRWYLHTQLIPYMPPSTMYGLIPFSFVFFLLPIIGVLPVRPELKGVLLLFGWVVCLLLAIVVFPIWKPNFLKPKWLRRLEAEYPPDVIAYFRQEWSKMDRDEWARKIGTEEGMEELVRLVTN